MEKIKKPNEYVVCQFDGVCASAVYVGGLTFLKGVTDRLKWRVDEECSQICAVDYKILTLNEIVDQLKNLYGGEAPMITVIEEQPISGRILQYGNYGDEWWQIGETGGYA